MPTPIHFAPGSYGAVADGQVTSTVLQQSFSLQVRAGQVMIITFTGAARCEAGAARSARFRDAYARPRARLTCSDKLSPG
jgi:hypothetical protein